MNTSTEEQIAAETARIETAIKLEMERILEEQRKKRETDFIHAEAMRRIQRYSALPTYTIPTVQPHVVKSPPTKEKLAEETRIARINAEAEQAALARRKLAQIEFGEKKAAALDVWINSPMNWDEIQDRQQQKVGGFSMVGSGWTKESIEPEFWKWVDSHDGFSVCPTCKNTPKVIRKAYSEQSKAYFYTEGLWKSWEAGPHGSQYGELISIHCCEHLYEYKTQKRYVLSSAMKLKRGTPTTNFIVKHICGTEKDLRMHEIEYSDYNPEDPLGELAYAEQIKADKLQQIETLRLQLAALEAQ